MDAFKDLRVVDNFYQTSAFFPMPTVLAGTVAENGMTNLGAYSLCFPYYIAGKDYYAMLLECRNSSNTAQNILRGKCVSLNFIPDDKKYFREAVRLGFPGDTTEEKMKNCLFTLIESPLGKEKEISPAVKRQGRRIRTPRRAKNRKKTCAAGDFLRRFLRVAECFCDLRHSIFFG